MTARNSGIGSLGACRGLIHAFRAGAANCLLAVVLLAATPLQVTAQTQGISVSVDPAAVGQYVSIMEGVDVDFTVSRTGDNSNALTVTYASSAGGGPAARPHEDAVEGTDYTDIPTSHTFGAGSIDPHKFTVTINDDDRYEPNEYFTLEVSGTYVDGDNTHSFEEKVVVRIRENDERYLTLSPVSGSALGMSYPEFMAKEGGIEDEKNKLEISLSDMLPYDLDIGYTVGDDPHTTAASATLSKDFTMSDGIVQITSGNTSAFIDINIVDDDRVEPTEYFTLRLKKPTYDNMHNAIGLYPEVEYKESEAVTQLLSVSIMDNDTAETGGFVYLRGEEGGGIPGFPNTRETLTEGQNKTITAEIAGAAPTSDIHIPLTFDYFPSGEATSADHSDPGPITIKAGEKTGSVTLTITDDDVDERYRELLVVEIDDSTNFPTGYTKGRTFGSNTMI